MVLRDNVKKSALLVFSLAMLMVFAVSCEGPAGPAGADGTNGTDGTPGVDANSFCVDCHTQANMDVITADYETSVHGLGAVAPRGAGASCARCHSNEGFQAFVAAPSQAEAAVAWPSRISCVTCHGNHRSLEPGLTAPMRTDAPITGISDGTVFDFGNESNLCGTCHQARRDGPSHETTAGDSASITSSHDGPHHGPQVNVLFGNGGYGASTTATHTTFGCVDCHMGEGFEHTFNPAVATCNTSGCHTGVTSFDINGKQTSFDTRMEAIAQALVAKGLLGGDATAGYHPVVGKYPINDFKAFWNYMYCYEDHSHGVHNPGYISTLLGGAELYLGIN